LRATLKAGRIAFMKWRRRKTSYSESTTGRASPQGYLRPPASRAAAQIASVRTQASRGFAEIGIYAVIFGVHELFGRGN
jgi:hypothetical protein